MAEYELRVPWLHGEATCTAEVEGRRRAATWGYAGGDPPEDATVHLGPVTWQGSDDEPAITYGVPGYPIPAVLERRLVEAALTQHEDRLDHDRDHEQWRREQSR